MHFNIKVSFVILCLILYILKNNSGIVHKLHQTGKGVDGPRQVWEVRWLRVGSGGQMCEGGCSSLIWGTQGWDGGGCEGHWACSVCSSDLLISSPAPAPSPVPWNTETPKSRLLHDWKMQPSEWVCEARNEEGSRGIEAVAPN